MSSGLRIRSMDWPPPFKIMHSRQSALGTCPLCNASIPEVRVLIEYETADGPDVWAECPSCLEVVHPEN
jgi:carbonic anhydrase